MTALAEIRARLETVTQYHPAPHRPVVNSAGDRWGVVDSNGCVVTTDPKDTALLYAHAPNDIARLIAAVEAVEKVGDDLAEQSDGRALDYTDDAFERGWHGANRAAVAQLREALADAIGGAK